MDAQPASATQVKKIGSHSDLRDLLLWLALLPFVLGFLMFFGQLALLLSPQFASVDTRSLLKANYLPWPYDQIAPVNVEAFVKDVQQEQQRFGTPEMTEPTVIDGVFWVPPTATAVGIGQETPSPQPTNPAPSSAPSNTPAVQRTPTTTGTLANATATLARTPTVLASVTPSPTSSRTVTLLPPQSATPTVTNTVASTRTLTPTTRATRTSTSIAVQTSTYTPTVTRTTAPPPTNTSTVPVAPTNTLPPAPTAYAPVRPVAENDGVADAVASGTCRAYFGYRNDNSYVVTIQVGASNRLSEDIVPPPQTTVFEVGRVFSSFSVDWTSGQPLTWTLEGKIATAFWCNPK